MSRVDLIEVAYLIAAFCLILGLRWLSSPRTARRGNGVAAIGMTIAIIATLVDQRVVDYVWIVIAAIVGGSIGALVARRVQMTAMPQLVAALNGLGGGAAAMIAVSEYHTHGAVSTGALGAVLAVSIMFSAIVGSISFAGSMIAVGKLQELLPGRPITWPAQKLINGALAITILGLAAYASLNINDPLLWIAVALALLLGAAAVLPIGGGDMPVVIAFLNACTGLAAAATGFALGNSLLIIAGVLVGASGTLLTQLMSKAMNRSLTSVLFGAFGGGGGSVATSASGELLPFGCDLREYRQGARAAGRSWRRTTRQCDSSGRGGARAISCGTRLACRRCGDRGSLACTADARSDQGRADADGHRRGRADRR